MNVINARIHLFCRVEATMSETLLDVKVLKIDEEKNEITREKRETLKKEIKRIKAAYNQLGSTTDEVEAQRTREEYILRRDLDNLFYGGWLCRAYCWYNGRS